MGLGLGCRSFFPCRHSPELCCFLRAISTFFIIIPTPYAFFSVHPHVLFTIYICEVCRSAVKPSFCPGGNGDSWSVWARSPDLPSRIGAPSLGEDWRASVAPLPAPEDCRGHAAGQHSRSFGYHNCIHQ